MHYRIHSIESRRRYHPLFSVAAAAAAQLATAATLSASVTSATWLGNTGAWTDDAWTCTPFYPNNGVPPNVTYDAVVPGFVEVNSRIIVDNITLNGGGSLRLVRATGATTTSPDLHVNGQVTINGSGSVQLSEGIFSGKIVSAGSGTFSMGSSGRLDGAALDTDAIFRPAQGYLDIRNGLTVFPNRTYTVMGPGNVGGLSFTGDTTLNGGTLVFGSNGSLPFVVTGLVSNNSVITIGPAMTIRTGGGNGGLDSGTGTLGSFVNLGTLSAESSGFGLSVYSRFHNGGTILVSNNSYFAFNGTRTADLGTIINSGGTIFVGNLDNRDETLHITPTTTGSIVHQAGSINGGTIETSGGAQLLMHDLSGQLNNVTVAGDILVVPTTFHARATVTGTVAFANAGRIRLSGNSTYESDLVVPTNCVFSGNGEIDFEGTPRDIIWQDTVGTMTVGPGVTIRTAGGSGFFGIPTVAIGTISNQGTIASESAGRFLTVSAATFLNSGAIRVSGGGSFTTSAGLNNDGSVLVSTGGAASIAGNLDGEGTASIAGGTFTTGRVRQSALSVGDAGIVTIRTSGAASQVSRLQNLSLAPTGKLNLSDNDLIVDATPLATIAAAVVSARAGGSWTGFGISSSSAANQANHATTLGVMSGADFSTANGGSNSFDGQTITDQSVLVKYTWYGDTDFNGQVNFDDYVRIDDGFNNQLTGWVNGDFDLNGTVNFDDYVLIDLAFNTQSGTLGRGLRLLNGTVRRLDGLNAPALLQLQEHFERFGGAYAQAMLAAVPEPSAAAAALATAVAASTLARRRRCQSRERGGGGGARRGISGRQRSAILGAAVAMFFTIAPARAATLSEWTFNGTSSWTDVNAWSTAPFYPDNGNPSGTTYDVHLAASSFASVTLNSDIAVDRVTLDSSGATLNHAAGIFTVGGAFDVTNGIYSIAGGTLRNATLGGSGGITRINNGGTGTFDSVTLARRFDLGFSSTGTASLNVNALTLASGELRLTSNGTMNFLAGPQQIGGTGTLTFAGRTVALRSSGGASGTVTIGSGVNVVRNGGTGSFFLGSLETPLVNNGTITTSVNFFSPSSIEASQFVNNGTIRTTNEASITLWNAENHGTVTMSNNGFAAGSISFRGNWSNDGTITGNAASLFAGGTFSSTSLAGISLTNGGNINVVGWMNNAGHTLDLTLLGVAPISLGTGGVVAGGTLNATSSFQFNTNGTVAFDTTVLTGSITTNGVVTLRNDVRLDGTLFLNSGRILLRGASAFTGPGTIQFGGGQLLPAVAGDALEIPEGTHVRSVGGASMRLGDQSVPMTNKGTIIVGGSSTISASSFQNFGTIALAGGVLNLTGNFSRAGLGTITYTSGSMRLTDGTLDLQGSSLDVRSYGGWSFNSGTFANGTLTNSGTDPWTMQLLDGTLDHVMLDSNLFLRPESRLVVRNGLTLNDRYIILNDTAGTNTSNTLIAFSNDQTVSGTGQFVFNGLANTSMLRTDGTVTFGPGITIDAVAIGGIVGSPSGTGRFINQGTIAVETDRLLLQADHWVNQGVFIANGGDLQLGGTFRSDAIGTIRRSGSGTVTLFGAIDNVGQTIDLSTYHGTFAVDGGAVRGGNFRATDPALVDFRAVNSQLLLDGVTLQSDLTPDFMKHVHTAHGMTLDQATVTLQTDTNFIDSADQALAGVGTVIVNRVNQGGSGYSIIGAGTIGNGVTLHTGTGGQIRVGTSNASLVNSGTILADNAAASVMMQGAWSNLGAIRVTAGYALLGGTFSLSSIGDISVSGTGTLAMDGTLNMPGQTLLLSQATGDWTLNQSAGAICRINGGTIATVDGTGIKIQPGAEAWFDGVTIAAPIRVDRQARMRLASPTLNFAGGTVTLIDSSPAGGFTSLYMNGGTITLTGNGIVQFDGPNNQNLVSDVNAIEQGVVIRTRSGGGDITAPTAGTQNRGSVIADAHQIRTSTFNNQNIVQAMNSGTLLVTGMLVNSGTVTVGTNSLLRVNGAVNNTGTIDISGSYLIDYTTGSSPLPAVVAQIVSGRNGGAWDGAGINSSAARAAIPPVTTLGAMQGSEWRLIRGASTLFAGQSIDDTSVLVKYTYYGDTDFNGRVNFDDYVRTDSGFNNHRTGWVNGDFDLNGTVNFDDYVLIDLAFNAQSGTLGRALAFLEGSDRSSDGMSDLALGIVEEHFAQFGSDYAGHFLAAVPEPTSVAMIAMALAFIPPRRRHG